MMTLFLHGLESSSRGFKARWFSKNFSEVVTPDFTGVLAVRMKKLRAIMIGMDKTVLIGSSFGGLMATLYAMEQEGRVEKVILLAPALNFPDFVPPVGGKTAVPSRLYIGSRDTVCPPEIVLPLAKHIFSDLSCPDLPGMREFSRLTRLDLPKP